MTSNDNNKNLKNQKRNSSNYLSSLQQTLEEEEEARRRARIRARKRRNQKRIQQRNQRVVIGLIVIMFLLFIFLGMIKMRKETERKAQQTYVEQQEKEKQEEKEKESTLEGESTLKIADDEEKEKWYLKLVNLKNPVSKEELEIIVTAPIEGSDYVVDERIIDDLEEMLSDANAEGRYPYVCSAYRSWDTQEMLFENKIERVKQSTNLTGKDAEKKAATVVARPGTSEHQLGLALDITASDYTNLDEGQMKTEDQKWLMKNCWKYGFILRYPVEKTEITGVIFEPWHYRYVGKKAAKEITEQGITLEEYIGAEPVGLPDIE